MTARSAHEACHGSATGCGSHSFSGSPDSLSHLHITHQPLRSSAHSNIVLDSPEEFYKSESPTSVCMFEHSLSEGGGVRNTDIPSIGVPVTAIIRMLDEHFSEDCG